MIRDLRGSKQENVQMKLCDITKDLISKEISLYSSNKDSLLSKTGPNDLVTFDFKKQYHEFQQVLPLLTHIVSESCCINVKGRDNVKKTLDSIQPVIVTIISKILSTHNQRLTRLKYINSIILKKGGAKDTCINRLANSGDCMTQRSTDSKMHEMSQAALAKLESWDNPAADSCVVFDNVNPYVRVRQETETNHNKLYNLTQAIAVKYKVPTAENGPPDVYISDLNIDHLLPTDDDEQVITNYFNIIIRNILASYVPSLEWMAVDTPKHINSDLSQKKTDFVSF